jgi:glycosyltransferase involved in cell wall biosynthesis
MVMRIGIIPQASSGGVGSFLQKFSSGLNQHGLETTHNLPDSKLESILVLGGTRRIDLLWRAKQRGVKIVQRLDGINWIHRRRPVSIRHTIRAEYGNLVVSFIRHNLADAIVYQSHFSKRWWEDWYGSTRVPFTVIHNGVDLDLYKPDPKVEKPQGIYRLLMVEGNLGGGYDFGLTNGIHLAESLSRDHHLPVELMVVGKVEDDLRVQWNAQSKIPIRWAGFLPRDQIPAIDNSAHLFFSADLHPACPNSVIEALACGLPAIAFDTGSLSELVIGDSGRVVPYGGDAWKLAKPDIASLARNAAEMLSELPRFQSSARVHAEKSFGLDSMVDAYLKILVK